jgi:hypothetical protein
MEFVIICQKLLNFSEMNSALNDSDSPDGEIITTLGEELKEPEPADYPILNLYDEACEFIKNLKTFKRKFFSQKPREVNYLLVKRIGVYLK